MIKINCQIMQKIKKELQTELGGMIDRLSHALSGCSLTHTTKKDEVMNSFILHEAKQKVEAMEDVSVVDELSALLTHLSL